ncbi:dirigent protein 5 [Rhodamnia argentea]|uniref:Dirigent protein n=1 Tax=Rhodamnia argentea TaxID=178133 RepID=A0A8B8QE36_9MYRT|nr:dirigent protein 5 [Rhodamnia argentea]
MLPRFIFCGSVILATLAVILLALFSPVAHRRQSKNQSLPWLALSLYIQQPSTPSSYNQQVTGSEGGAFTFHRTLTEGPENTSRVIGRAQGFIIPIEHFAHSAFNVIYLTFNTATYYGSLGVEARHITHEDRQELTVVGGTGDFAFARGLAVFAEAEKHSSDVNPTTYHIKLELKVPNRSQTIPG